MGTSLKIVGLKRLIKSFVDLLHNNGFKVVYINLTKPSLEFVELFDYCLYGKADDICTRLGKLLKNKQVTSDIRKHFKTTKSKLLIKIDVGVKVKEEKSSKTDNTASKESIESKELDIAINVVKNEKASKITKPIKAANVFDAIDDVKIKSSKASQENLNSNDSKSAGKLLKAANKPITTSKRVLKPAKIIN